MNLLLKNNKMKNILFCLVFLCLVSCTKKEADNISLFISVEPDYKLWVHVAQGGAESCEYEISRIEKNAPPAYKLQNAKGKKKIAVYIPDALKQKKSGNVVIILYGFSKDLNLTFVKENNFEFLINGKPLKSPISLKNGVNVIQMRRDQRKIDIQYTLNPECRAVSF